MASPRKHQYISLHPTLKDQLEVNWEKEYQGEYCCVNCGSSRLKFSLHRTPYKIRIICGSCSKVIYLACVIPGARRIHLPISTHPTLTGTISVDWSKEYQGEFCCVDCGSGRLRFYPDRTPCKIKVRCGSCSKEIFLSCVIPGARRIHLPISTHPTLTGTISVDWSKEYQGEYYCLKCKSDQLNFFYISRDTCRLFLRCRSCKTPIRLTCPIPIYISTYQPDISCPNPLCKATGPIGQKGWVYFSDHKNSPYKCRFCRITFNPNSTEKSSWVGSQQLVQPQPFCFEEDVWNLQHFFDIDRVRNISFKNIRPKWYQYEVKHYIYELLKNNACRSLGSIRAVRGCLEKFGQIVYQNNLQQPSDITREIILFFLDSSTSPRPRSAAANLGYLKAFFEWLELDADHLIRRRDFPNTGKTNSLPPTWLDEPTRTAIKQHLHKIPAPIARQYLIQEYTAARQIDICQILFNCLIQDNSEWQIQFFQRKVSRWHVIPATREIRRIIEDQQQWIRQTLGEDYPYLFCHFRAVNSVSYPSFPRIKPIPKPPTSLSDQNPMVRIIRWLIEKEDIRDINGQTPHFVGKITRSSRLQEVRIKHGIEAAQLYADHVSINTTFQHYTPPTLEEVAAADLPFQKLLLNPSNKFLPWQSLPESLLKNPEAHELDLEISPRLVVYGYCVFDPKIRCPYDLYPKCYGCGSFCPSTDKLPLYERQYAGEVQRLKESQTVGAELAFEEAKDTIEAMDKWLPKLREVANG